MSELVTRLQMAGESHKGTDLGGLLQWAALHIEGQDEALAEVRTAFLEEEGERLRLESALHAARIAAEAALEALKAPLCPPLELFRDIAPHINRSAAEGDPDYMRRNGLATSHTDLRTPEQGETRKKKA